jgi:nucleoside-diphosphate-sugar epimerase
MSELGAEIYSKNYGMKILSLRFATTYGPRDKPDKLIPKLITRSIENQDLTINNSKKEFDFIYIDDIINGIYLGIKHIESIQERYYDSIPLCTGKTTNLEKLAKVIIKETKSASNIIIKEEKEEVFSLIDSKKAKKILGFEAKVSIEEGIKKTIENFNSY